MAAEGVNCSPKRQRLRQILEQLRPQNGFVEEGYVNRVEISRRRSAAVDSTHNEPSKHLHCSDVGRKLHHTLGRAQLDDALEVEFGVLGLKG